MSEHPHTCLIPPPRTFLTRKALSIKSLPPTMTEPIGQPKPCSLVIKIISNQRFFKTLLKQMEAESENFKIEEGYDFFL